MDIGPSFQQIRMFLLWNERCIAPGCSIVINLWMYEKKTDNRRNMEFGFFTISKSDRKSDRISARQKNSGKINLLKSCLRWDLISQQQPSLLWSLTPNQLGHGVLCWMGDLSNELQSHSIDSRNYQSPKS